MKLTEITVPALTPHLSKNPMPEFYQKIAYDTNHEVDEEFLFAMKIVEKIKRDCQPYIKEMDQKRMFGHSLYRGMDTSKRFLKKRVRLGNRQPTDMLQEEHDMINRYFTKKYGAPYRNALFLTGDAGVAMDYNHGSGANYYLIFPIDKFSFIWSTRISDLYSEIDDVDLGSEIDDRESDNILTLLSRYRKTNLKAAINSGNEIMLRCKSYYAVSDYIINDYGDAMNRYMAP